MKKLFAFLIAVIITVAANAQILSADQVPAVVKTNFASKFPGATATWSQETPGFLDGTFYKDKHKVVVMYVMNGDWISTDTYLKEAEYPAESVNWIKTNLPNGKINSFDKSETGKGSQYEAEVKTKEGIYRLTFDMDGKMLTKDKERKD